MEAAIVTPQTATFRANPQYMLRPWNRLGQLPGPVPEATEAKPQSYGLLTPREGVALPVREVSPDTALVFLALQDPGPIPPPLAFVSDRRWRDETGRLLLENVIELATPDGFASGLEACRSLGISPEGRQPVGRLAQISWEALRYGALLQILEPTTLAHRLYFYYRWPPRRSAVRIDGPRETLAFLGLRNTMTEDRIHREWDIATAEDHWLVFARRAPVRSSERKTFKLYVSPRCEELPSVFAGIAHALFDAGADQFKVGAGTVGLLRPDKIVAYFGTRDDLLAATDPVLRVLGDTPAHGVPFSASLSETGIISWGADPNGDARTRGESWRQWVTTVLASGMVAGALDSVDDMCARALARLQFEGVDPSTYAPTAEWSGWGFQ